MRNQKINEKTLLLDQQGRLMQPGYSDVPMTVYNRESIKAPRWRIKEWDYYLVQNEKAAFALTIADLGYLRMVSASFLNFESGKETTKTIMLKPSRRFLLPDNSNYGHVVIHESGIKLDYSLNGSVRKIDLRIDNFYRRTPLLARFTFEEFSETSMNINTPFEKDGQFYMNRKQNCLKADGDVSCRYHMYSFYGKNDLAVLDWGRGVWPYTVHWIWATGSGYINRNPFGFTLGCGFGNTQAASENMVFYGTKAWKLDDVVFEKDAAEEGTWNVQSSDGGFEGVFRMRMERKAHMDYLAVKSDQKQYFCLFTGKVQVSAKDFLDIKDFPCAIEDIFNQY